MVTASHGVETYLEIRFRPLGCGRPVDGLLDKAYSFRQRGKINKLLVLLWLRLGEPYPRLRSWAWWARDELEPAVLLRHRGV